MFGIRQGTLFKLLSLSLLNVANHRTMTFQATKDRFLSMSLEEKRQHYKCGSKFVTLDKISTWPQTVGSHNRSIQSTFQLNPQINEKISIFVGDITTLEIDAIVNAANAKLAGGGGVDGFIHRAAGADDLQAECRTLNGCQTGFCKMTGGYRLPAKYVIHCVGPVGEKADLLAGCYKSALDTVQANKLRSVAFPCISTGVYGYPNENAAHVALNTVRSWLEDSTKQDSLDRVIFCLFLDKDLDIYNQLLPKYFPIE